MPLQRTAPSYCVFCFCKALNAAIWQYDKYYRHKFSGDGLPVKCVFVQLWAQKQRGFFVAQGDEKFLDTSAFNLGVLLLLNDARLSIKYLLDLRPYFISVYIINGRNKGAHVHLYVLSTAQVCIQP